MKAASNSSISRRAVRPALFMAPAIFAAAAFPAYAIDYSASGSLDAQVSHNDNLRMTERNKVSVNKYLVTPIISLGANSEKTTIRLNSIFYFNRYDESQFDSDDQNIGLSFSHQMERLQLGLNANWVRDSTVTSEQLSSGIVSEAAERAERKMLSGSASYTLNDSNALQLQGTYLDQDYSISTFTSYENSSASLDWIHVLNERWKAVLSANYSKYKSDELPEQPVPILPIQVPVPQGDGSVELVTVPRGFWGNQSYSSGTETAGGQIGIDYQWSEQSLIQARAGSSNSKSSRSTDFNNPGFCTSSDYAFLLNNAPQFLPYLGGVCEDDSSTRVSTAELTWSWSNENQQFNLSGTKQTSPTSNGYTVDSTQVNTNWSYKLTELDTVAASLVLVRNRALDDASLSRNAALADRDYGSVNLSYRRQIGEKWYVSASYQYSQQEYTEQDINAHANVVSLTVRYTPQGWHWAR